MDENDYKTNFDEMTSGMQMEQLAEDLIKRADVAQAVAVLSARIYKAARKGGLPRSAAMAMAKDYWDSGVITEQEMKDLAEIRRLLDEAYDHYFANSDGHCKSSEGYVGLHFNHYFDRQDGKPFGIVGVEIYSYVFDTSRSRDFSSTSEALEAVKKWHEEEMQETYEEPDWDEEDEYEFRGRW